MVRSSSTVTIRATPSIHALSGDARPTSASRRPLHRHNMRGRQAVPVKRLSGSNTAAVGIRRSMPTRGGVVGRRRGVKRGLGLHSQARAGACRVRVWRGEGGCPRVCSPVCIWNQCGRRGSPIGDRVVRPEREERDKSSEEAVNRGLKRQKQRQGSCIWRGSCIWFVVYAIAS